MHLEQQNLHLLEWNKHNVHDFSYFNFENYFEISLDVDFLHTQIYLRSYIYVSNMLKYYFQHFVISFLFLKIRIYELSN